MYTIRKIAYTIVWAWGLIALAFVLHDFGITNGGVYFIVYVGIGLAWSLWIIEMFYSRYEK
jgi:hypothetical protein